MLLGMGLYRRVDVMTRVDVITQEKCDYPGKRDIFIHIYIYIYIHIYIYIYLFECIFYIIYLLMFIYSFHMYRYI